MILSGIFITSLIDGLTYYASSKTYNRRNCKLIIITAILNTEVRYDEFLEKKIYNNIVCINPYFIGQDYPVSTIGFNIQFIGGFISNIHSNINYEYDSKIVSENYLLNKCEMYDNNLANAYTVACYTPNQMISGVLDSSYNFHAEFCIPAMSDNNPLPISSHNTLYMGICDNGLFCIQLEKNITTYNANPCIVSYTTTTTITTITTTTTTTIAEYPHTVGIFTDIASLIYVGTIPATLDDCIMTVNNFETCQTYTYILYNVINNACGCYNVTAISTYDTNSTYISTVLDSTTQFCGYYATRTTVYTSSYGSIYM